MSTGPLETVRAEDFIEYFLFPRSKSSETATNNDTVDALNEVIHQINDITKEFCTNYIWHKDPFRVTPRYGNSNLLIENSQLDNSDEDAVPLPPHIYGITHFDDNIQDEWFIVALLFELSKQIDGLIIRVVDSDGEFMLIEAADHLPDWANPDTCEQRIYILDGCLHMIHENVLPNDAPSPISMADAVNELKHNPTVHRMSAQVMDCIQERIKSYPSTDNLHRQAVFMPVMAAALLVHRPQLVAPAVRAFCHRDQIDMKACRAMKYFPPENRLHTSVVFTKYLYAMLTHSQYTPDRRTGWNLPPCNHDSFKAHALGVKLACGFEILASQAKPVGDLETNKNWLNYLESLKKRGYFQNFLEGSIDHQRLLSAAKEYYRDHVDSVPYSSDIGQEILTLLKTVDYNIDDLKRQAIPVDDDESWLNVSTEELDEMLASRYGIKKTISANGNVDAMELTGNISEFLDKKSEWEGIDVVVEPKVTSAKPIPPKRGIKKHQKSRVQFMDTSEGGSGTDSPSTVNTSNNIDFNPDAFQTHVKEMLDLIIPDDNWESNSDMSDFADDDDMDRNIDSMGNAKSIKHYMEQMDAELARTTLGQSFEKKSGDDSFEDIESFKPVDIDVNTLKNLAHSYQSQYGGPGPASTLLGSMGIHVKPDENTGKLYNTQV